MYKNILIPLALDHNVDLVGIISTAEHLRSASGKITLVAVLEEIPSYVVEYTTVKPAEHAHDAIKKRLNDIANEHENLQVAVLSGKPGVAIPELASEVDADLIVVGSQRPGVEDYFLGSTASRIVRRAPCAVLVLR